jgi:hypothetical protein
MINQGVPRGTLFDGSITQLPFHHIGQGKTSERGLILIMEVSPCYFNVPGSQGLRFSLQTMNGHQFQYTLMAEQTFHFHQSS